jgi:hypothetical protein
MTDFQQWQTLAEETGGTLDKTCNFDEASLH